jgi:hypothetical protein
MEFCDIAVFRHRQRPHEVAEVVGQRMPLEANGIGSESAA